jgi:hypothetical protein
VVSPAEGAAATRRDRLPDSDAPRTGTFEEAEAEYFSEPRDGRWAPRHESSIVAKVRSFPEVRVTDVECHSKSCRMVMSFPGVEQYNAAFRGIAEDESIKQSGMVAMVEGNEATIYLQRTTSASSPN